MHRIYSTFAAIAVSFVALLGAGLYFYFILFANEVQPCETGASPNSKACQDARLYYYIAIPLFVFAVCCCCACGVSGFKAFSMLTRNDDSGGGGGRYADESQPIMHTSKRGTACPDCNTACASNVVFCPLCGASVGAQRRV